MYGFGRCFGGFGTGFGLGGGIFMMLLSTLVVIAFVYFIFRSSKTQNYNNSYQTNTNNALEILKMRYAKGEINDAEFAAKKEELLR